MFSNVASRLHAERNPLYCLRDELLSQGITLTDLISGNVHEQGIQFPASSLEKILVSASRRCAAYQPDSFGRAEARAAISEYYRTQGFLIPPEQILLTPGSSIAYWYCFKLLANEGEEIHCPSPSYPLFDYIAALSGVRLVPYRLDESKDWAIDIDYLESTVSTRSRALILISPHNPTGHVSPAQEVEALADVATRHNFALICDEVFSEFLLSPGTLPRPAAAPLILTLNGFSKMYALPGLKLGWLGVSGEPGRVTQALRALELISDTFLPVNEIAQAAVPGIFAEGAQFLSSFTAEVRERWKIFRDFPSGCPSCTYVQPGGGFYVTLRLEGLDEEAAALAALREEHLLLHPGYYYDMTPHHLVLSFIQHPKVIRESGPRLASALGRIGARSRNMR